MARYWAVVKWTYVFVIAPVVLVFLYNIVTDPATPALAKAAYEGSKRRLMANLGYSTPAPPSSAKRRAAMKKLAKMT